MADRRMTEETMDQTIQPAAAEPAAAEPAARPVVVAVDGPAGSGKSSVSREAARRLGYELLDTGAAYRAFAWHALANDVDLGSGDPDAIARAAVLLIPSFQDRYAIALHPDERWVRVGEDDVTDAIRDTAISEQVSAIARVPQVRAALTDRFRRFLRESTAPGIIAEGRDITTVVAPDADARILLTADESVRIARRAAEKSEDDAAEVARSVSVRDAKDRAVVDFLEPAPGVELLDSTDLDFEQTVIRMLELIRAASRSGAAGTTN
ncbi:Cytidylate kinase [Pseudoclavibacter triregionum]|nr:Cytidylate kinase [Pseudoclavibacter triregionum]